MTKQNLFVPEVKNHVSRNAFDLSHRKIFSSKCGEILPCLVQECIPGDKFRVKASSFARTAPLNEAAFLRMKQYYNFYFVPYRLLYRDFPSFVVQQSKSSKAATAINADVEVPSHLPYVNEHEIEHITQSRYSYQPNHMPSIPQNTSNLSNFFTCTGLNRMTQTRKLLQYLGYYKVCKSQLPSSEYSSNNSRLSLFPLLAYQKVYNDFYRFSQWENEQANTYNVDYLCGSTSLKIPVEDLFINNDENGWYPKSNVPNMFDMRYVNFTKDTFLGVVPTSQFGAVSTADVPVELNDALKSVGLRSIQSEGHPQGNVTANAVFDHHLGASEVAGGTASFTSWQVDKALANGVYTRLDDAKGELSILGLRAAQAKQKFLEVTLSNNSDYKSQIEAHFNVKVSSIQSGLCDYIGGFSADLSINTVVNTNLNDGASATYSATSTSSGNGDFEFEAREHGLIIGITYGLPFIDYSVIGYDVNCLRNEFSDFALPEYDRLGFESVDPRLLVGNLHFLDNKNGSINLGYSTRYYDYKTAYDVVLGDFNKALGGTQPNFVCTLSTENNMASVFADDESTYYKKWETLFKRIVSFGFLNDVYRDGLFYGSFKVSPTILNGIFSVGCGVYPNPDDANFVLTHDDCSFDQFYNVVNFNITCIRNLDRLGLPY